MKTIIALLIVWSLCWAGEPDTIWTKKFGSTSWDFAQGGCADFSGGFALCGSYQHPAGPQGTDMYVVRVDALTGNAIYARTYGGTASDQAADLHFGIFRVLVVGTTSSYGADPSNVYVVATNAVGDTNWTRAFDTGGVEGALAVDRYETGDYFIAGYKSFLGNFDGLVMKMDSTGTLVWSRVLGGANHDQLFDVIALADGGCVAAGETYSFGTNAPPRGNAWMIRYDAAGDTVWTRALGDSAHDQRANAIKQTQDGGFMLAGYQEHPLGDQDFLLVKTDASGNEEWSKVFGGGNDDALQDIVESCENFTVSGYTESFGAGGRDGYLAEIDLNGDTLWTKTMGGADEDILYALSSGCNQWYDAGYYATGLTKNNTSGPQDAWLVKLGADPQIWFTAPGWCDHFVIGSTITATWGFQGFEAYPNLSLELNRDYPAGTWDVENPNFYNAGFLNLAATGPASGNCRLRVTKLDGGLAQAISEPFTIIPTGMLQYPTMDWDSSWYGSVGIANFIATDSGAFVYPYGSSIIKRDSVGDTLWMATYSFGNNAVSSGRICQLATGEFVALALIDTLDGLPTFLVCSETGTPHVNLFSPGLPDTSGFVDIAATDSGGFWLLSGKSAGSYTFGFVWHSANNDVADTVGAGVSFGPKACALADDGLMIAGDIGDIWMIEQDILLVRVNNDYDTLWTKRIDFGENDYAIRLKRFEDGRFVLLGKKLEWVGGTWSSFVAVLDDSGNVVDTWDYTNRDEAELNGLSEDADGRILVCGSTKYTGQASDYVVVKFDCGGTMDWEIEAGGANSEHMFDVSATSDGGYLACGDRFFPSGPGLGTDRPTAIKFGPETFYTPPACPPADSLVIKKDDSMSSVTLTWKGSEQGAYFIYTSSEPGDFPGGGWSQIACVEAGPPPARATLTWTDYNLTPEQKFYVIVHECNQSCGGGEN